jgi:hypothetical protein
LEVNGIVPNTGPTQGGTILSLSGSGFLALSPYGGELQCRFGTAGTVVVATATSDETLQCVAPAIKAATRVIVSIISQD